MSEIGWDSNKTVEREREREGGRAIERELLFFGCIHLSREYMLSSVY